MRGRGSPSTHSRHRAAPQYTDGSGEEPYVPAPPANSYIGPDQKPGSTFPPPAGFPPEAKEKYAEHLPNPCGHRPSTTRGGHRSRVPPTAPLLPDPPGVRHAQPQFRYGPGQQISSRVAIVEDLRGRADLPSPLPLNLLTCGKQPSISAIPAHGSPRVNPLRHHSESPATCRITAADASHRRVIGER